LRDYQSDAETRVRQALARLAGAGVDPYALLVAPTGAGKTTIAASLIARAIEEHERGSVLFIAHRKELLEQCSARLMGAGVRHGIVSAAHRAGWKPWLRTQVASIQSLSEKRVGRIPEPTLIIIDEAHRARADSYMKVLHRFPGVPAIGLTATPVRSDNKGLGDLFRGLVVVETIRGLTDRGYLTPATGFAFDVPDLSSVRTTGGDYNEHDLGEVMGGTAIVGNIVEQWVEKAGGCRTVLFAATIEHSLKMVERFKSAGVRAEHVDGKTKKNERGAILQRLEDGKTTVVCNVGVLTEGWDSPRVECCILARPTKSQGLYLQMVGRVLRPVCRDCRGDTAWNVQGCRHCGSTNVKRSARIHDHAGCVMTHGLPDADREWSLDVRPVKGSNGDMNGENAAAVRSCSNCFALYDPRLPACPCCGHCPPLAGRTVQEIEEGVRAIALEELAERGRSASQTTKMAELRRLVARARADGRSAGWVLSEYRRTFFEEPRWRFVL
jgi:superfamily II DNA or RNA helicase